MIKRLFNPQVNVIIDVYITKQKGGVNEKHD